MMQYSQFSPFESSTTTKPKRSQKKNPSPLDAYEGFQAKHEAMMHLTPPPPPATQNKQTKTSSSLEKRIAAANNTSDSDDEDETPSSSEPREIIEKFTVTLPPQLQPPPSTTQPKRPSINMDNVSGHDELPRNGNFTSPYSNYQQSYSGKLSELLNIHPAGLGNNNSAIRPFGGNDEILEKLNQIVHMLEEQQVEKTAHVTEEFAIFTLLGVGLIYIVDSFTKSGRYVR